MPIAIGSSGAKKWLSLMQGLMPCAKNKHKKANKSVAFFYLNM
jgi:hypothetical protein